MRERLWYLQKNDLLCQLNAGQLSELEKVSQFRVFSKASPIYLPAQPADSLLLVASGLVKICHLTPDGKSSTLALVKTGELFGELALWDPSQRGEYAEAVEETTVVRIPRSSLQALMQSELDLTLAITKLVGLRRQKIENRLRNLLFTSNSQRLAHLLLDLAEQFGEVADEGIRLGLRLSHQELANLIGATRESVTILLGNMKKQGLVGGKRNSVVLLDVNRLAQSVGRKWDSIGPWKPA